MGGPKFDIEIKTDPSPITIGEDPLVFSGNLISDALILGNQALLLTDDSYLTADPSLLNGSQTDFRGGTLALFGQPEDFMTGGNRSHNAEADYLVREIVKRVEASGGSIANWGDVRDWVHNELIHFKNNGGNQRNGNVSRADWSEVIDHGVTHFSGRSRSQIAVVETTEDMHLRIEELIDQAFSDCGTGGLISASSEDFFRDQLRTQLRSDFAKMLMNEWGSENLEDISDFMRNGVVMDFEGRAEAIISRWLAPLSPSDR